MKRVLIAMPAIMLIRAMPTLAQISAGGDVAGGYMWKDSHIFLNINEKMKHAEGKADLWLGHKGRSTDWHLTLTGRYRTKDNELAIQDNRENLGNFI